MSPARLDTAVSERLYRWRVKAVLPERFGQSCRVLVWGPRRAVLVEFLDGYCVRTSGNYVRRIRV